MRFHRALSSVLLCLAGCSVALTPLDENYDPRAAHETLTAALDAWKSGDVKALVSLNPPIRFADDDLVAGFRLVDYELAQSMQPIRAFQSVPVTLTIAKGKAAPITRAAMYQITLKPACAVLRSDP